MKIALLFAGQYREISENLFKKSLSIFVKDLDYDIYSFLWDEEGKSLNHKTKLPEICKNFSARPKVENLFKNFNLKKIESESYNVFLENMDLNHKKIFNSKSFHFGTINSLPQIYALSKCFNLLDHDLNKYDLVFRCRFDSLFIHPLKLYNLEAISSERCLYNINFGRAYYPNRVYDIFFGGSIESMRFLKDIWTNLPNLVNSKFNNNLDKRDCCRLLYLAAIRSNIEIASFESRCCDIYRNKEGNYYEAYLISMHLISMRLNKNSIAVIIYFKNWLVFRSLNIKKFIFIFLKTFLIMPISYLKRALYLFSN